MPFLTGKPTQVGRGSIALAQPALELRLLTGGQLFRNLEEFRRVMRHRYVLAHCAGLTVPAIVLLYALDNTDMPIDLQVPSVVVGMVTAQAVLIGYLVLATRLARMICSNTRIIRVWITPGLMFGAAGMLGIANLMHQVMGVQQDWTEMRSQLVPFLCMLYLEVAATIVLRGPVPRALAQLRVGQEPLPDFTEDEGQGAPAAPEALAGDRAVRTPQRPDVALGMAATEILRLEASGNYVTVVTRKGRHLVPGPFSAAVAQMPAQLGRQVQRSHWVALAAVEGVRRKGRELWLHVTCGALVPVSSALRSEVQLWLEQHGKDRPSTRQPGWQGLDMQGGHPPPQPTARVPERLQ